MDRKIGETERRVFPIGLGAMPLSIAGRPAENDGLAVIEAFVAGGGNLIDTANVYCLDDHDVGHNERLIAKALQRIAGSGDVLVATKGGLTRPRGSWEVNGTPSWLRQSCEQSLKDLEVGVISLYQLHAPDPNVPLCDSVGELVRLKEEGKILEIGLSNVSLREVEAALELTKIVSVQNRCNVFRKRDFYNGIIDLCRARGMVYVPHSPVGGHHGHARLSEDSVLRSLARKYACSTYSICLTWLLHKGEHIIPIPGASKVSSVEDSRRAAAIIVESADIERLDRLPDW